MTVCQIEFVADFFVHSKTQIGTRSQLPIMKNKKYKKKCPPEYFVTLHKIRISGIPITVYRIRPDRIRYRIFGA